MSDAHTAAADAGQQSNPVKLAIWIGLGTLALVVGIILLAQFAVGAYGGRSLEKDPVMSPEALAKRIGPVAKIQFEGAAPVTPTPESAKPALAAVPAQAGKADGKSVYDASCMACHATGAAGAPKFGDKAAWAMRLKAGSDALYASAIKGKGAMPAKGGNAALADADVKAAVDYIAASSR